MTPKLSWPFRLAPSGGLAVVDQGSDAEVDSQLQHLIATVLFERPMAWSFGLPDPVWNGIDAADIQAALAEHGPDGVTITEVVTTARTESTSGVKVQWTRSDATEEGDEL